MPHLNAQLPATKYEITMEEERKRKPPMCDAIAVKVNERTQALAVARPNVAMEKRGVGGKRKKRRRWSRRNEEESVV
jgi:hypothetical protein